MPIIDRKVTLVKSIKNINCKINGLTKRFINTLDEVEDETERMDELMEYIHNNINDFKIMFTKYNCLPEININNVRFRLYYYDKQLKGICGIDLDDYYGIELYQYDLIIGGPNHGNLIINGNYDENINDYDIIHNLNTSSRMINSPILKSIEDYDCIDTFKKIIQNMYDNNHKMCTNNDIKRKQFKSYIRKHRVELITDVYKKLSKDYTFVLDYSDGGRETYNSIMTHSKILINDINREVLGFSIDKEYFILCKNLKILVNNVRKDMQEWYENVDKYIDNIANDKIGVSDISSVILKYV